MIKKGLKIIILYTFLSICLGAENNGVVLVDVSWQKTDKEIEESYKENVDAYLSILKENKKQITSSSYIKYLANAGIEEIKQALQPFGYYTPKIKLDYKQNQKDTLVNYNIELGSPVLIKEINIEIIGEGKNDTNFINQLKKYPLKVKDILEQEKYTTFKTELISVALTYGYFDAEYEKAQILLNEELTQATINLVYNSGTRYKFDNAQFDQDFLDGDVFNRYLTFKKGDNYSSKIISSLQRDLYNSGYVKLIDVEAKPNKKTKTVPVNFIIGANKNKMYKFALGYGTDTGARARFDFDWRWVNRRGHSFKSKVFFSQKMIDTGVEYRIPDKIPTTDYYKLFANYKIDKRGDLDSNLFNIGGAYNDKVGNINREFGLKWQQENFKIGNDSGNISLLTPYIHLIYKKADDPLNTKEGLLLDGYIAGGYKGALSDVSFLQAVAKAKYIKRLNKHKVTAKAGLGKTWVDNFHNLPPAYRFFLGGDRTIRGYSFDKIGDYDLSGDVIGGDKMYFASLEYEYFFKEDIAVATFVDAGDSFSNTSKLKVGAGIGLHYYSPIGPIKLDVAHGFNEPGDKVRIHFTIGADL